MTRQKLSGIRMSHSTWHQSFPSLGLGFSGGVSGGKDGLQEAREVWDDLGMPLLRQVVLAK